jgi:cytoskeleton protein RodZ
MPAAEIGATLREARMRARVDISEIEAQTKIRAKYLRALENEEWDLLPGPTFVKSFLRTYAQALDLDDKAIVEEYRQYYERPNEADLQPIVPAGSKKSTPARGGGRSAGRSARGARGGGGGPSRGYVIAIGAVSLVILLLVVGLLSSGSSNNSGSSTTTAKHSTAKQTNSTGSSTSPSGTTPTAGAAGLVALSIHPTASVYVCLIDAAGRKLIPGLILQAGAAAPTYHSHRFMLTLGNASARLYIDGSPRPVPPSSNPIGYSITKAGGRHTLPAGQLPTCK